jgi:hypothetical protein
VGDYIAIVETTGSDRLLVLDSEGFTCGKGLLNFQGPLSLFCAMVGNEEEIAWFQKLDDYLQGKLCEYSRPFFDSLISGDWNYHEDEYEFYAHRHPDLITEEVFKKSLERADNCWTDINLMMTGIQQLLKAFKELDLEETYYYYPDVVIDFEALYATLELLRSRRVKKVRINIE